MWWVYALLSALFAALTAVFAKAGVAGVDPDVATAVRTVVILCIAWGIVFAKNGLAGLSGVSRGSLLFLVLSGVATGLSWIMYFRALHLGQVSSVAAIDKLSLAMVIVMAAVFFREAISLKMLAGSLLMIAGALVIIL